MKAIVCVTKNWGIGKDNKLICTFKEDMNHFKQLTAGKAIVAGRKTFETFCNGKKPLIGRKNIVITSDQFFSKVYKDYCKYNGVFQIFGNTNDTTLAAIKSRMDDSSSRINTGKGLKYTSVYIVNNINVVEDVANIVWDSEDTFVCGGGSVYKQLLPLCDTVYVTMCDCESEADTYFPNLDQDSNWKISDRSGSLISESGIKYEFITYSRS